MCRYRARAGDHVDDFGDDLRAALRIQLNKALGMASGASRLGSERRKLFVFVCRGFAVRCFRVEFLIYRLAPSGLRGALCRRQFVLTYRAWHVLIHRR